MKDPEKLEQLEKALRALVKSNYRVKYMTEDMRTAIILVIEHLINDGGNDDSSKYAELEKENKKLYGALAKIYGYTCEGYTSAICEEVLGRNK